MLKSGGTNTTTMVSAASVGAATFPHPRRADQQLGDATRVDRRKGILTAFEDSGTLRAWLRSVQDEGLPANDIVQANPSAGFLEGRVWGGCPGLRRFLTAHSSGLGRLVPAEFGFDVVVSLAAGPRVPARLLSASRQAVTDAVAGGFGLSHHVFDHISNIVAHGLDDTDGLLEHVSHQVRYRDPQALGDPPDVLRQVL